MLDAALLWKVLFFAAIAWLVVRLAYAGRPDDKSQNRFAAKKKEQMQQLPKPASGVKHLYRLARASEPSRTGKRGKEVEQRSVENTVGWVAMDMVKKPQLLRRSEGGYYGVPALDDSCLHLSTMAQVQDTARLYFKGIDDLILLKFSTELIENDDACDLRWEAALPPPGTAPRPDAFPHVYSTERGEKAKLSWWDLMGCIQLPLGADGTHTFPPGWDSEEEAARPLWPEAATLAPEAPPRDVRAEELDALEEQLRKEMLDEA